MTPTLEEHCTQLLRTYAAQQHWLLPPAGMSALVKAIMPTLTAASVQDISTIQSLAATYYIAIQARCLRIIQALASEEDWDLPPDGQTALVEAILPFVLQARRQDQVGIRQIAQNYNRYSVAVAHMLMPADEIGRQQWLAWYPQFMQWLRAEGIPEASLEDLSQDAFLRAKRALTNFRFECTLDTFFHSVVRFCYLQWSREERNRRRRFSDLPEEQDEVKESYLVDPASPIAEQVASDDLLEAVRAEFARVLNSEEAQIILLYDIEQTFIDPATGQKEKWTFAAIGQRLGVVHTTVQRKREKVLQRLAKKPSLRQLFEELIGRKEEML